MNLHVTLTGRIGPQSFAEGGVPSQMHWRNVAPSELAAVLVEIASSIRDAALFKCCGSVEILVQAQAVSESV